MRRQLVFGAAAVTAMVLIAFIVPLGIAVRILAENRPVSAAEQTARSLATVVALTDDEQVLQDALTAAQAGSRATLTIFFSDGRTLGASADMDEDVRRALGGTAFATDVPGGRQVFVPALRADGSTAAVRALVPSALLRQGVTRSWLLLAALAVGLLLVAIALADALARSVVRPVRSLAQTAGRLAQGDLEARVTPAGPAEITEVGTTLNALAVRIAHLLAAERELVAELSHRLRTPLTALRINAESVADPTDRARLEADVDAVEATVTHLIQEARQPRAAAPSEPVDMRRVVLRSSEYWGALADEQGRQWTVAVPDDPVPLPLTQQDGESLIDVLLDNVFTHTPEATSYAIRLTAHELVVADDGPGPSATGTPGEGEQRHSTGLGLSIVKRLAQRLDGGVTVERPAVGGTRVTVTWRR